MKINFVGDLCFHGIESDKFHIEDDVLEILKESDLNIANLESPLTLNESIRPNTPVALKAEPKNNRLYDLFHVFSLANNHILDYGAKGFFDTVSFLEKSGKRYFGAGQNLKHAYSPLKVKKNSNKIAFLGFTRWVNARGKKPGTTPASIKRLSKIVKTLKDEGCFVIIMPHWNYEYVYFPSPDNRNFAKKLLNAGADLIVGSHPHIVQGYERYKNKYIFHSLGNFVFHSDVFKSISMIKDDPRLKFTFILTIKLKKDFDYKIKITPLYTDGNHLRFLKDEEKVLFEKKLADISEVLNNKKKYRKYFYRDAADISNQSTKMLKKLAIDQGLKNLLITLKRVKKQDIKIKLYSLFLKKRIRNDQYK